jgi:hypothetical protein
VNGCSRKDPACRPGFSIASQRPPQSTKVWLLVPGGVVAPKPVRLDIMRTPMSQRACRASQTSVTDGGAIAGAYAYGGEFRRIVLQNVGRGRCTIDGAPWITTRQSPLEGRQAAERIHRPTVVLGRNDVASLLVLVTEDAGACAASLPNSWFVRMPNQGEWSSIPSPVPERACSSVTVVTNVVARADAGAELLQSSPDTRPGR